MSKVPSDFISPRTGVTHSGTKLWSPRPPPLFPSLPAPSLPFLSRGPTSPQPAGGGPWHLAEGGDPLSITPGGRHFALSTRHTPGWDLGRPRLTKGWHQERETDGGLARFACLCAGPETLTRGTLPEPGTQAGRCAWWGGGTPQGHPQMNLHIWAAGAQAWLWPSSWEEGVWLHPKHPCKTVMSPHPILITHCPNNYYLVYFT